MTRRKLLILGLTWPEPKATAAGIRIMQLIQMFQEQGWDLSFACTASNPEGSATLEKLGIPCKRIKVNDDAFDQILLELQPDAVLFDRYITEEQFGWRVSEYAPDALRLLDTEDLHSLRIARQSATKKRRAFQIPDWLNLEETKREMASIYRSDLSLVISEYEMQLLREVIQIPEQLVYYLPLLATIPANSAVSSFKQRSGFVFLGNGRHQPNIDAIDYLYHDIWPLIRKAMPEARLRIYGAYLPDFLKKLHDPGQGFEILGYVEDADRIMQMARINLAPLRFGAGLKGKLIIGLKNGTPAVTTSIGAEGLMGPGFAEKVVFDTPESFAMRAVELYQDETEWTGIRDMGLDMIRRHFHSKMHKASFLNHLNDLRKRIEEHRQNNFIGSMLHHHTLQSTKYLSRWISCKNALNAEGDRP